MYAWYVVQYCFSYLNFDVTNATECFANEIIGDSSIDKFTSFYFKNATSAS